MSFKGISDMAPIVLPALELAIMIIRVFSKDEPDADDLAALEQKLEEFHRVAAEAQDALDSLYDKIQ